MVVDEDDVRGAIELMAQICLFGVGQADELKEKQKLTLLLQSSWRLIDSSSMCGEFSSSRVDGNDVAKSSP